jgi:hypothetical protein
LAKDYPYVYFSNISVSTFTPKEAKDKNKDTGGTKPTSNETSDVNEAKLDEIFNSGLCVSACPYGGNVSCFYDGMNPYFLDLNRTKQ